MFISRNRYYLQHMCVYAITFNNCINLKYVRGSSMYIDYFSLNLIFIKRSCVLAAVLFSYLLCVWSLISIKIYNETIHSVQSSNCNTIIHSVPFYFKICTLRAIDRI